MIAATTSAVWQQAPGSGVVSWANHETEEDENAGEDTSAAGFRGPGSAAARSPGAGCRPRRNSDPVRRRTGGGGCSVRLRAAGRSTIGFSAPITGPVAAAGAQMLKWGQFAQTRWNRAHPRLRIRLVQGDTQLPDTAQAVRVAEGFAVERADARGRRPGGKPGDRGLDRAVSQGRACEHLRHGHGDRPDDVGHAARVLLPHRPERRSAGGEGRRLHARHRCGRPGSSSSTRRTATAWASRTRSSGCSVPPGSRRSVSR